MFEFACLCLRIYVGCLHSHANFLWFCWNVAAPVLMPYDSRSMIWLTCSFIRMSFERMNSRAYHHHKQHKHLLSLNRPLADSLTHSCTHVFPQSPSHSLPHSVSNTHSPIRPIARSLTYSLTSPRLLTHALAHSLTRTLAHSRTHVHIHPRTRILRPWANIIDTTTPT